MERPITAPANWATSREEIERLCGYIKRDSYIANYFGISVKEVTAVRKAMPKEKRGYFGSGRYEGEEPIGHCALKAKMDREAKTGSQQLLAAIQRAA